MPDLSSMVGALVVANVATILTVLGAAIRGVWFVSKMDSRIDYAHQTAVRAHKRIDAITGDPDAD